MKKELGILALLVVLCLAVAVVNQNFYSPANLQNTGRLVGIFGIFSLGVGLVIITGGIDLSVGSLFALLGVLLSFMLVDWRWPWPLAVLAVLAIASLLGAFHGLLVTRLRIQPFVVTLCGLLLYRGLARYVSNDQTRGFGYGEGFETLQALATGKVLGIPLPLVYMVLIALVVGVLLHHSVYGRYLMAVGGSEEAARFSGVNTALVVGSAYVLCSLLAGVSAILLAFYTNSVQASSHGSFYELYGIAAAVVGGCSLRGGEGSVPGILIGAALLQLLQNLVNLLGIPSSLNFAVMGAVILVGVVVDQALQRRRRVGRA
jgi:ribose transport system permease protein